MNLQVETKIGNHEKRRHSVIYTPSEDVDDVEEPSRALNEDGIETKCKITKQQRAS